jgi:trans-L-3-hydroxyproline dehydratase
MIHTLDYVDFHTCGEPVRIVTGGYPVLNGETILQKRQSALRDHDRFRRALMLEPRGHAGMYGVIPVESRHPEAAFGVLFTHNEGYSTMCGHATIALGRYALEHGLVPVEEPVTRFAIEAPCGLLRLACEVANGRIGRVGFDSVPAFVLTRDLTIDLPEYGKIACDIAYGGAFYAILPASRFGLDYFETPVDELVSAAACLTDAIRATVPVTHPDEPDLSFLYGTILTDDAAGLEESCNLCVFAERQIDRSPTGSGVTARMALDHVKGNLQIGKIRRFRSITGGVFTGCVIAEAGPDAVTVNVTGESHVSGSGQFHIDDDDPLAWGFSLPETMTRLRL